ncbi:MAG: aminoacyl-tRNA hydrolase [Phycisphaeraceae bacterium]|nr:MAG: aminoacyl-tRNA hydrolase [Phycisphaeraceae bacterium]
MKVIVGLGNPGSQYSNTRHNVGFMVIDRLAKEHAPGASPRGQFNAACIEADLGGARCLLVKPTTYMNRSGQAVSAAVRFYKVLPAAELLVIVDDVYLGVGQLRLRPAGGAGGHNGLADIESALGSPDYPRLRIGVGATPPFMDQADWVLGRFTPEEAPLISGAVERASSACVAFASRGLDAAMNQCNAPPPKPRAPRGERGDQARGDGNSPAPPGGAHGS